MNQMGVKEYVKRIIKHFKHGDATGPEWELVGYAVSELNELKSDWPIPDAAMETKMQELNEEILNAEECKNLYMDKNERTERTERDRLNKIYDD